MSATSILESLELPTLESMARDLRMDTRDMTSKHTRTDAAKVSYFFERMVQECFTVNNVKAVLNGFHTDILTEMCENVSNEWLYYKLDEEEIEELEKEGKLPKLSKSVMAKRLAELVAEEMDVGKFVKAAGFTTDCIRNVLEHLDIDDITDGKKNLTNQFVTEFGYTIFRLFLSDFSAATLKLIAEDRNLDIQSNSVTVLTDHIIADTSFKKKKAKKEKPSKTKPDIEDGIRRIDLLQWFTADELKEYLKDEELKLSGKKAELATRILKHLDPDIDSETLKPGYKQKMAKKRREERLAREAEKKKAEPSDEDMDSESSEKEEPKKKTTKKRGGGRRRRN